MDDIALYYPYSHIQNDSWLKAAALYWPRIGLIRPLHERFPKHDSAVARALTDATGLIVHLSPDNYIGEGLRGRIAVMRYLRQAHDTSLPEDAWPTDPVRIPGHPPASEDIEWIFTVPGYSKMSMNQIRSLLESGLCVLRQHQECLWLGVHPGLAREYLTLLAAEAAERDGLRLVTDQSPDPCSATAWIPHSVTDGIEFARPNARSVYAAVSLETVVPANLESVPVEKIIKVRRELAPQFAAFRTHLDDLADIFAEYDGIESPQILKARAQQLAQEKNPPRRYRPGAPVAADATRTSESHLATEVLRTASSSCRCGQCTTAHPRFVDSVGLRGRGRLLLLGILRHSSRHAGSTPWCCRIPPWIARPPA